jgi:flagellar protein FliJ
MAQFRFRLESLLKLRLAERDHRREELANAYRADQVLQQRLASVREEIVDTQRLSKACSAPGTVHVDKLLHSHRYELILVGQLQQIHRQRQLIANEIDRRRQALVEADQELRILEKLREKHATAFAYHEHKADIRLLDEMALRCKKANSEIDVR